MDKDFMVILGAAIALVLAVGAGCYWMGYNAGADHEFRHPRPHISDIGGE